MKKLSIIVPCYNEEEVLPLFYAEITRVMDEMKRTYAELTFELLFIDDGSRDKTLPPAPGPRRCRSCGRLPPRTSGYGTYPFPAISARKPVCLPVWRMQQGTLLW